MAEEKKEEKKVKERVIAKPKREERKPRKEKDIRAKAKTLVRIADTDIPGETNIYHGLTYIKGVSWSTSNAICNALNLDKKQKVSSLSASNISKINNFLKNPSIPKFLLNRRFDRDTGEDKHLITTDLDLRKDFDIRHLRKIRSYKGVRHASGLPVRGQRTRSHFRKGRSLGVQRSKARPQAAPKEGGKKK